MALCLLCGIPGSGKSTIAHIIQSIIEKETTCKLFSFDDYELDKSKKSYSFIIHNFLSSKYQCLIVRIME
jgi:adenylate kinase